MGPGGREGGARGSRSPARAAVLVAAALAVTGLASAAFSAAGGRAGALGSATATTGVYANPLTPLDTPDPDVIRVGSTYYAYSTGDSINNITEMSTTSLGHWPQTYYGTADALPQVGVWATVTPGRGPWAPSVVPVGAGFDMFYAAFDPSEGHYCIGVATSATPAGPFRDTTVGPIACQPSLGGSIDPSAYYGPDGTLYLTWKSNDGSSKLPATIWGAQLQVLPGSARIVGTIAALMPQDQQWETTVENPFMEVAGGQYYLLFSGGLYNSTTYSIGYALCSGPLGPCRTPFDHPIVTSVGAVAGPGAPSVFSDPSGRLWMAYHAWTAPAIGYGKSGAARSLRIDPFCLPGGTVAVPGPTDAPATLTPSCPTTNGEGYQMVAADGGVFNYGTPFLGSMGGRALVAPIVGAAVDPATGGYWEVASDGGIFSFGAPFYGSMGGRPLQAPVVGMAATPDGGGYWEVASDGGVFAFGDAAYDGSMGGRPLVAPIVAIATDQWTGGYWMVASDGGVFAFGAGYFGSMGGHPLDSPIVTLAPAHGGLGYWEVAADGGVFAFGAAPFLGSMGGHPLTSPIVAAAADGFGDGYWMVGADGGVFAFGAAAFGGSAAGLPLVHPVVALFAP